MNYVIGDSSNNWIHNPGSITYVPPTTIHNRLEIQRVENGYVITHYNTLHIAIDVVQLTELIQKLLGENK